MLNTRSDFLTILVPTFNRLELLKQSLASIAKGTRCSHEVIVIDRGSTDGTIEFLRQNPNVTSVFQGESWGMAGNYNATWRQIRSKYTCWLSDDDEIVPGCLDLAVQILEAEPDIGMVGLKMKDTMGPGAHNLFMGGVSPYGILNCNHGVLLYDLLSDLGFFNDAYRLYGTDPDLTASVLCAGKKIVHIKQIAVLHHRAWSLQKDSQEKLRLDTGNVDVKSVYHEHFAVLKPTLTYWVRVKLLIGYFVPYLIYLGLFRPEDARNKLANNRYWNIFWNSRFISSFDSWYTRDKPYEFVQSIPANILLNLKNPYRALAEKNISASFSDPA